MKLIYRQLTKEILKNKIFVTLMLMCGAFTPFLYYFVRFSTDGNLRRLDAIAAVGELSGDQALYRIGLVSNTILARNVLLALTMLTCFVFVLFFYRFFKANGKQLGCMKSLGFKDGALCGFFVTFAALLSFIGWAIGLGVAYFAADVLIAANAESYLATGLVKEISPSSALVGFIFPALAICAVTFFTYGLIRGKEEGLLMSGVQGAPFPATLRFANALSGLAPAKNRLALRLALRKPVAVLLIAISVMTFSVMFIMGYSLTLSSQKVFESQTTGHNYLFDAHFDAPQVAVTSGVTMTYLDAVGTVNAEGKDIAQTIAGMSDHGDLFVPMDESANALPLPQRAEVLIGSRLQELYGLERGDSVTVTVNGNSSEFKISGMAFNAKSNWVYISKAELCEMLLLPEGSYTGILGMDSPDEIKGGAVRTHEQRMDALRRDSVSNRSSSVINQVIGCAVGSILLYLALLLNFQDSTRDMLILRMMGHQQKSIRKMLIDIYRPVLWLCFLLTLPPAVLLVKSILRSLSLQIGDYMPFQTNIIVIAGIFALLNVTYLLVQSTFNLSICRILQNESIADHTN